MLWSSIFEIQTKEDDLDKPDRSEDVLKHEIRVQNNFIEKKQILN